MTLELLESSQIAKYNLICRNYCILLKISKEESPKILWVLGKFLMKNGRKLIFQ
ncbi:hypothetical protein LEP1GSC034_0315 [Leptospira interrogans str. 2003000735]|uniref:Uncharacterized protein n=3 Tax=Leptospira interrogans TaxID=173 RepID=M6ZQD1_LEPIR|nr:hypothetical protein LEP1GSC027_2731 [Leptospira interrogans str. 2002000624]EKO05632.1 hypothetical protein LEP1GSC077_3280 [Leptospira interrogans str. C10069]EKQ39450.1 hypothetical protein LEP1GSC025_1655 [Leptospira interrogans str. 2002000621]EKQ45748.1 hypothetical protein LEP1GSC026_1877 [Leptospira interrogans str. 2002000623]EMJ66547.1 hypothetical protein LEP1GSC034_0315 [Leptospira interrogans str. 2003000735]EMJ74781.1 hypothetical protein LEP1GSC033_4598 [Leptospira interrogan